jgi:S-adenosylmethionine uptake transporter
MTGMTPRSDRTTLGIGLAFLSFAVLSGADALTKLLSSSYSIYQIGAIDAVFAALIVFPVIARAEGIASFRLRRPGLVVIRCALGAGSLITAFLSFSKIPLADAYAIAFVAPLAVTALSVPLLREHVGWRQWMAVVIGFVAVVGILRPNLGTVELGQLYMLASALLFGASLLMLRRIAATESTGGLSMTYLVMLFLMSLPLAIADWHTPTWHDLILLVAMGMCSGFGNLLLIYASRMAPAAIVSSFMYTQLIWGSVLGLMLFGDKPDLITLGGSFVIIACGLYTLSHASRQARMVPI